MYEAAIEALQNKLGPDDYGVTIDSMEAEIRSHEAQIAELRQRIASKLQRDIDIKAAIQRLSNGNFKDYPWEPELGKPHQEAND